MVPSGVAAGTRREQQQRGSQSLAAAANDVVGDLPDEHDVRVQTFAQHAVDRGHVVTDDGLQEFERHERAARMARAEAGGGGGAVNFACAYRGRRILPKSRGPSRASGWPKSDALAAMSRNTL